MKEITLKIMAPDDIESEDEFIAKFFDEPEKFQVDITSPEPQKK